MLLKKAPLLFLGLYLMISPVRESYALDCMQPSLTHAASRADAIFTGRITKIAPSNLMENGTIASVHVIKAYKGVDVDQTVHILREHWEFTPEEWHESTNDKKTGLFALKHISNATPSNAVVDLQPDAYFIGLCDAPYWPFTKENESIVKHILNAQSAP